MGFAAPAAGEGPFAEPVEQLFGRTSTATKATLALVAIDDVRLARGQPVSGAALVRLPYARAYIGPVGALAAGRLPLLRLCPALGHDVQVCVATAGGQAAIQPMLPIVELVYLLAKVGERPVEPYPTGALAKLGRASSALVVAADDEGRNATLEATSVVDPWDVQSAIPPVRLARVRLPVVAKGAGRRSMSRRASSLLAHHASPSEAYSVWVLHAARVFEGVVATRAQISAADVLGTVPQPPPQS